MKKLLSLFFLVIFITAGSQVWGQTTKQCQAITSKGTQCKRSAEAGSNYCWQHKSTYEPNSDVSDKKNDSTTVKKSTTTPQSPSTGGRIYQTGPKGGTYYINSHGNKTYVKKK